MQLMYRPDADAVRKRMTTWWAGGDIGRPAMQIRAPRETPWEAIPAMPEPAGWITGYSTSNFDYRVNLGLRYCHATQYMGEAMPFISPDLAPGCLSLFLGCKGREMPGTVWCEPFIKDAEAAAEFRYDPHNFYWKFSRRLAAGQTAPVQVLMDGRRSNSAQIATGYVSQAVQAYAGDGGSYMDAYGVVKCAACARAYLAAPDGKPRDRCPHCHAPAEPA